MLTRARAKLIGGGGNGKGNGKGNGSRPPNSKDPVPVDPDNCCICLSAIVNRCTTNGDGCRHNFCYQCLLTWSRTKAECPLCKSAFTKILHNYSMVNGAELHDEFEVPQVPLIPLPGPQPQPGRISSLLRFYPTSRRSRMAEQRAVARANTPPGGRGLDWNFSLQLQAEATIPLRRVRATASTANVHVTQTVTTDGSSSTTSTDSYNIPVPAALLPNAESLAYFDSRPRGQPTTRPPPTTTHLERRPSLSHSEIDLFNYYVYQHQREPQLARLAAARRPPPTLTSRTRVTIDLTEDEAAFSPSPVLQVSEISSEVSTRTSATSESTDSDDDEVQIIHEGPVVRESRSPSPTITFDSDAESVAEISSTSASQPTTYEENEDEVDDPSSSHEPSTSAQAQQALLDHKGRNRKRRAADVAEMATQVQVLRRRRTGFSSHDPTSQPTNAGGHGIYLNDNSRESLDRPGSSSETSEETPSAATSSNSARVLGIGHHPPQVSLTRLTKAELASYGIIQDENEMAVNFYHMHDENDDPSDGVSSDAAAGAGSDGFMEQEGESVDGAGADQVDQDQPDQDYSVGPYEIIEESFGSSSSDSDSDSPNPGYEYEDLSDDDGTVIEAEYSPISSEENWSADDEVIEGAMDQD